MEITITTVDGEVVLEDEVLEEGVATPGDDIYEGVYLEEAEGYSCREFLLASVTGVPEQKVEIELW